LCRQFRRTLDQYLGVFMKTRTIRFNDLARPINASCFQLMMFGVDESKNFVTLVYTSGRECCGEAIFIPVDEYLLRELVRQPVIREAILKNYGDESYLDHTADFFELRVVSALESLEEEGLVFVLLRGSEVSLDRMVILQDSSPEFTN
jgi:hypothetical protein